jgi:hypothetical protein
VVAEILLACSLTISKKSLNIGVNMKTQTIFDDTCAITELRSGKVAQAEVISHRPQQLLVVTINRSVKLTMPWNPKHEVYQGTMAGMEFESSGPVSRTVRVSR